MNIPMVSMSVYANVCANVVQMNANDANDEVQMCAMDTIQWPHVKMS